MNPVSLVKVIIEIGSLVTRVEKCPDGRWKRLNVFGIPVWDRARMERRQARREARRAATERDAR
jgi:hypothetical protein